MFGRYKIKLDERVTFHFLNLEDYSPRLLAYIEQNIHYIWNGDNEAMESLEDLKVTKQELLDTIKNKVQEQKIGWVAEFICHLYIRANAFKQHFLFSNLEEKGMKKGFDGLYLKDDLFFILESKSSLESTTTATHNSNISEAYNDLKKKIEGVNPTNNPWKNAYNHANSRSINYNDTISKSLKKLSHDYVNANYTLIENYNIIPSSTIYLGDRFNTIDNNTLIKKIESLISTYSFKSLEVICVNKKSINNFINYLNA